MTALQAHWRAGVAEPLAAHTEPAHYEDGRLAVLADSPVWASRLRQQEPALLRALKQDGFFRGLREISVRVRPSAPLTGTAPAPQPAPRASRVSGEAARLIESVADTVTDPALRAALRRLGAAPKK